MAVLVLWACSSTQKVPAGEFLLTKNNFKFEDGKVYKSELPNYVSQKPNKKTLYLFPVSLWFYNLGSPKYDTILTEYMTYPSEMRNQKLRDSLFIKYGHPEYSGKKLFWERVAHTLGQPPVILEQGKTAKSAENIKKRLIYRGYWDSDVLYSHDLDSATKKAEVNYLITHCDPTKIKDYYYNIPDAAIKSVYEEEYGNSFVKAGETLDQTNLEKEVKRLTEQIRNAGYYRFNGSGDEIYFTADTLTSRKDVPLTLDIHKDSADTPYKKTTIGDIKVFLVETMDDVKYTEKDSVRGINFYKLDNQYKTMSLWRPVVLKKGQVYKQSNLDLTKRNFASMNNFNILSYQEEVRKGSDSILDVSYYLAPLPKFELKVATDVNYSQILNFGISPSVDLTTRNLFGGAENLNTSISGIFGSVKSPKNDKRLLAYEISAQANLSFPKLLLPFKYYKLIPKRYSPYSTINLGASVQNNIGLGRINFNAGLNYFANANDIVSHKLSLFNMQLSITKDKEKYYDFFTRDGEIRNEMFQLYSPDLYTQFTAGQLTSDDVSKIIMADTSFQNGLTGTNLDLFNNFRQSLINKDRQTQDVIISSILYNFIYNEIGKKDLLNPFYLNVKFETSGNMLGAFSKKRTDEGIALDNQQKTIFSIPYSQFVKFDVDVRKYFQFFDDRQTLVLRQFIGIGIPYGNSTSMPVVRSYFNGGSNDIRAWRVFGGLGPSDSQLDERVRAYVMDNVKLTTNIEYRMPFTTMFEGAAFVDAGNIWSLRDNGFGDQFKFSKFISQMGVGAGVGLRVNVAFITFRLDAAWKVHDPNQPVGQRWGIPTWKPVLNFAFGYPF